MLKGIVKDSRYEILAILRDDCKAKSDVDLYSGEDIYTVRLQSVDSSCFHISVPAELSGGKLINGAVQLVLHSTLGKIEFQTHLASDREQTEASADDIALHIPQQIKILQRRIYPRINLRGKRDFYCYGRHKSGETFRHALNDISDGGCSFICSGDEGGALRKGAVLKNVEIYPGTYEKFVTSLQVVSSVKIQSATHQSTKKIRVSCQFFQTSAELEKKIEDIILNMTIEQKTRWKRFRS